LIGVAVSPPAFSKRKISMRSLALLALLMASCASQPRNSSPVAVLKTDEASKAVQIGVAADKNRKFPPALDTSKAPEGMGNWWNASPGDGWGGMWMVKRELHRDIPVERNFAHTQLASLFSDVSDKVLPPPGPSMEASYDNGVSPPPLR
jgi:hypothetical protein